MCVSVVKSTGCSSREPTFNARIKLSATPVPGNPAPLLASASTVHTQYIDKDEDKTPSKIKKKKKDGSRPGKMLQDKARASAVHRFLIVQFCSLTCYSSGAQLFFSTDWKP